MLGCVLPCLLITCTAAHLLITVWHAGLHCGLLACLQQLVSFRSFMQYWWTEVKAVCVQTVGEMHLGEFVNRFRPGSLVMQVRSLYCQG